MRTTEKRTVLTASGKLLMVELGAPQLVLEDTNNVWEVLSICELEIKLPKKIDLSNPITEEQRLQKLNQKRHSNSATIFPKVGEVYCCVESCQVELQIFFSSACSTHTKVLFPAGEEIVINNVEDHAQPLWATFSPTNPALEHQLIPQQQLPMFSGFGLTITTELLNKKFKLID